MTRIIIDHGDHIDGLVWLSVNGEAIWVKAGEEVDLDDEYLEALDNANLSYTHILPNGTEPLIFLDFENGEYTLDGEAVDLDTLLIENADWGVYSENDIGAGVGLTGDALNPSAPVLTGEAFTRAAVGATILMSFTGTDGAGTQNFRYEVVDDLNDYNVNYYSHLVVGVDTSSKIGDQTAPDVTESDLADGAHKSALTIISGKISRSTDGEAIIAIDPAAPWSPAPTVMGFIVPLGIVLKSVGIYPAQDDADLPMLSTP